LRGANSRARKASGRPPAVKYGSSQWHASCALPSVLGLLPAAYDVH
jgi:hypothetical protein